MTSFVHVDQPVEHPGVVRVERAVAYFRRILRGGAEGGLMLAAAVSAVLVVANQVIDTWTDGHLLAAWSAMWAVAFAVLALAAAPAARAFANVRTGLRRAAQARRQAEDDRKLWAIALEDARVMADISRAMAAQEGTARG